MYDFAAVQFDFKVETEEQRKQSVYSHREEYRTWEISVLILSSSLMLQLVLRAVFNIFTKRKKVQIDKWCIMDAINSGLNIFAFEFIVGAPIWVLQET